VDAVSSPHVLSGLISTVFRIIGSTVVGKHSAVLEGLEGAVGGVEEDEPGENMTDVEAYGALGLIARPRVASVTNGETSLL
jgi:hypothetical protein